jgi:hypothetical protein
LESWRVGELESWKVGKLERGKVGERETGTGMIPGTPSSLELILTLTDL